MIMLFFLLSFVSSKAVEKPSEQERKSVCGDCGISTPGTTQWCDCCNSHCDQTVHCNLSQVMCDEPQRDDNSATVSVHQGNSAMPIKVHVSHWQASAGSFNPTPDNAQQRAVFERQQYLAQQQAQQREQAQFINVPHNTQPTEMRTLITAHKMLQTETPPSTTIHQTREYSHPEVSLNTPTSTRKRRSGVRGVLKRSQMLREQLRELDERNLKLLMDDSQIQQMLTERDQEIQAILKRRGDGSV
jgi:hypothetical protein